MDRSKKIDYVLRAVLVHFCHTKIKFNLNLSTIKFLFVLRYLLWYLLLSAGCKIGAILVFIFTPPPPIILVTVVYWRIYSNKNSKPCSMSSHVQGAVPRLPLSDSHRLLPAVLLQGPLLLPSVLLQSPQLQLQQSGRFLHDLPDPGWEGNSKSESIYFSLRPQ